MRANFKTACLLALMLWVMKAAGQDSTPKLIVGIVVDQLRADYIYRYYDKLGEDGFKRFHHSGFVARNGHFNYAPTYTGPGHASIFTGTTPAIHGVISNSWFDKKTKQIIGCVADSTYSTIGSRSYMGQVSPKELLSGTIGDALKLSSNLRSKTIGISVKDRSAVLPVGKSADGAFWYDALFGRFISSTYYYDSLPDWVNEFNNQQLPHIYLTGSWELSLPIEEYIESNPDLTHYEGNVPGKPAPVFPYDLAQMRLSSGFNLLTITPFANTLVNEFAKATITGENLGQDDHTDLLAVGFSATDVAGHNFGPYSVELEDMYIRLDQDLADLFSFLDEQIGDGQYIAFLTSDHGVVEVPQYLIDNKFPGGYYSTGAENLAELNTYLLDIYGRGEWLENISNNQIFLNRELLRSENIDLRDMQRKIADFIIDQDPISQAYPAYELANCDFDEGGIRGQLARGYNMERSGDVIYNLRPGYLQYGSTGTSHGSPYNYDTHVPILFYGWGIPKGETVSRVNVTDIAPTLSMLLNIQLPSGSTGHPIEEIFRE